MTGLHYADGPVQLWHGDCVEVMAQLTDGAVHAVVTDPPYDLTAGKRGGTGDASLNLASPAGRSRIGTGGFMGQHWDATGVAFDPATWREAFRLLKPGGHLLAFGGTRTFHRMAVAIEDAGFEIRDSIAWLYGSGFPKSRNLDGAWTGWGTALKPGFEPIVVARKPFTGSVAANVAALGTGALNIDATRIATSDMLSGSGSPPLQFGGANSRPFHEAAEPRGVHQHDGGRWPANVILDESQAEALDEQSGVLVSGANPARRSSDKFRTAYGEFKGHEVETPRRGVDVGGASRFFYTAKAAGAERPVVDGVAHPTVKPLDLMRWLVRLVTPPGGIVLEPFAGSGTTVEACLREGFDCIAIEREADYLPLILQRVRKPHEVGLDGWEDAS